MRDERVTSARWKPTHVSCLGRLVVWFETFQKDAKIYTISYLSEQNWFDKWIHIDCHCCLCGPHAPGFVLLAFNVVRPIFASESAICWKWVIVFIQQFALFMTTKIGRFFVEAVEIWFWVIPLLDAFERIPPFYKNWFQTSLFVELHNFTSQ